jgi:hypothetical protein
MWPAGLALAMVAFIGAFGGNARPAYAIEGDICHVDVDSRAVKSTDGQGNVVYLVKKGISYGIVFRVEDDRSLWLEVKDDRRTTGNEGDRVEYFEGWGENVKVTLDSETGSGRIVSQAEGVDDEYGYRALPSPASGTAYVWDIPNVAHFLINPGVLSQTVDTFSPRWFNDADGNKLDSINSFLTKNGYPAFANSAANVCGDSSDVQQNWGGSNVDRVKFYDDSWGFIDFSCTQAGYFNIHIHAADETLETGRSLKFRCEGQAESATISASPLTVETVPAPVELLGNVLGISPANVSQSLITVTVLDQFGRRLDGAEVTFTTDRCRFLTTLQTGTGPGAPGTGGVQAGVSPAGGGTTVTTFSDTDTVADINFITNNPLEAGQAGTAEVVLECLNAVPGVANITAIVQRPGANIVLTQQVTVIGPVALNGLTLTLTPTTLVCGNVVNATVNAVDANNRPVSPGTRIWFTSDTTSGLVGGGILSAGGAQGVSTIVGGTATVHIATDPSKPGTHTVIAHAIGTGGVLVQAAATYTCTGAVVAVVPTTAPTTTAPVTGTGTGAISPPRTGDAGLAAASGSNASLLVIAGVVAFALAGMASIRFARR